MEAEGKGNGHARELDRLGTVDLIKETLSTVGELAEERMHMFALEAKAQLKQERKVVSGIATAAAFGVFGFCALSTAAILGIAYALDGKHAIAALLVGAGYCLIALMLLAIFWPRRVRKVVPIARQQFREDLPWNAIRK